MFLFLRKIALCVISDSYSYNAASSGKFLPTLYRNVGKNLLLVDV